MYLIFCWRLLLCFPPIFCLQCLSISYLILVCVEICIWYFIDLCFFCFFPPIFCLQYLSISWLFWYVLKYVFDILLTSAWGSIFFLQYFSISWSFWYVLKCVFDILLMSASGILHFVIVPYVDINYHTSQIGITEN